MEHEVILEQDEDGVFAAEFPALPGCVAQGETEEKTLAHLEDAIMGYCESLKRHGETLRWPLEEVRADPETATTSAHVTCSDCGTGIAPSESQCPQCGSRNRTINVCEHVRMYAMVDLKQKATGYSKFKVRLKTGEKIAGASGQPAQEFYLYDKEQNLRCHVVAEQPRTGEWTLEHFHVGPLDPRKVCEPETEGWNAGFRLDVATELHKILRHEEGPHRRLTVPIGEISQGAARLLFHHAQLTPRAFAGLLLWVRRS